MAPLVRPGRTLVITLSLWLAACGSAGARASSGISGRVVAGPTCPVETVPPQPQCRPRPVAAEIRISAVGTPGAGKLVRSGADGRFEIRLTAGTYILRALRRSGSPLPRPPAPFRVRVHRGHFTAITISYDTGIR